MLVTADSVNTALAVPIAHVIHETMPRIRRFELSCLAVSTDGRRAADFVCFITLERRGRDPVIVVSVAARRGHADTNLADDLTGRVDAGRHRHLVVKRG